MKADDFVFEPVEGVRASWYSAIRSDRQTLDRGVWSRALGVGQRSFHSPHEGVVKLSADEDLSSDRNIAAVRLLLNLLVRAIQQGLRHRQTESLGGLQIDDEFELRRLFDRQVGGFGAFKNLDDIYGAPTS